MTFICNDPTKIHHLFIGALLDRNIDAALSLYHPDAEFVSGQGCSVTGAEGITQCLLRFMTVAPRMALISRNMYVSDDVALVRMAWKVEGEKQEHVAMDVLRRLEDGRWVFQIDNPYGQ